MINNLILFFFIIFLVINSFYINKYEKFENKNLYFYTFCVYIGRHSKEDLIGSLKLLVKSLNKYVKNYKLIVFKNFNIEFNDPNIIYRDYYQGDIKIYKNDRWKELSFNKLNIFKDLNQEFKKDFIWLDLDTIIVYDISYFNKYDNLFIINGGNIEKKYPLFSNSDKYNIKSNNNIQGNVWKINMNIYNKLVECLKNDIQKKNLILRYDLQDLFNYYIYKKDKPSNYNLIGKNIQKNILNGLAVWENPKKNKHSHGDIEGIENLFRKNGVLKTKYYPNYDIHILSITFFAYNRIKNNKKFKNLLNFN